MNLNNYNPASKLLDIFKQANSKSGGISIKQVWSEIFKIDSDNNKKVFEKIAYLYGLVEELKDQMKTVTNFNENVDLKFIHKIEQILNQANLDGPWENCKQILASDGPLYNLEICENKLNDEFRNHNDSNKELSDLIEEIEELDKDVSQAEINPDLKKFILSQIEIIRRGVWSYRVYGVDAFKNSIGEIYKSFCVENHIKPKNEKEKNIVSQWSEKLDKVIVIIQKSEKFLPVINFARKLLNPADD